MASTESPAFGELLRRSRRALGLTQEELAERAGVSARLISALESDASHRPRKDTLRLLAEALDLSADEQTVFMAAARPGVVPASTDEVSQVQGEMSSGFTSTVQTFLVADIRNYTRFTEEHGDEPTAQLAIRFAQVVEEVVTPREGRVVETRGDKALVAFSSARGALQAAVALQAHLDAVREADPSLPLVVRIGIDAGEAVPVKEGYRGGALNLAARLCSLAAAGDVFASEGVIHLARKTEGLVFVDRGEVPLKGMTSPVRVIQIASEGALPEKMPPLQPLLVTHPTNLPDESTPFIGRSGEIGALTELFGQPTVRLVTLTGTSGTGKTRLALQAGSALLGIFPDGVFFVSLAPLTDPVLVPSAIADVLSVQEVGGTDLLTTLISYLKKKHLLLVLDNFEHLLDSSSIVAALLDACLELRVLVTSRTPLHLLREHEYPVPPLAVPEWGQGIVSEDLSQYEAVELFIERAQAIKPDFHVTDQNAPAVAEICCWLDGLPLAIELAATRLRLLPPHALLQRLSHRLSLLTDRTRDRPPRHQTLRAAIDWSYNLLSPEEQTLFAHLSVFAGGCTLEATEAICAPEGEGQMDVLDGVASLVEKSLLRQEGDQETRFLMLETIREYATERLVESGTQERLKQRHARSFLSMAEEAAAQLKGPAAAQWLNQLAQEHDNLRAALGWWKEQDQVDPALRLAVALSRFWESRGYLTEGRRRLAALLPGAETCSPALQAAALYAAGTLAASLGEIEEATDFFVRSLVLYRQVGDTQGSAEVLDRLAQEMFIRGGDFPWVSTLDEHLTWGREMGDRLLVATTLQWLAWGAAFQRDATRARTLGKESLALYRDLGDTKGMVDALLVLVEAAYGEGNVHTARGLIEEITALLPRLSLDASTRERVQFVAYRARDWDDYEYATRLVDGAMTRALALGDGRNAAYAHTSLALFAREQGEYERAEAHYRESLAVFQEIEDRWGSSVALLGLADVARDLGDAEGLIFVAQQALELGREMGSPVQMGFALHNLGLAARGQEQYAKAEALLDESLAVFCGPPELRAEIVCSVGLVALDQEKYDRAETAFVESLHMAMTPWMVGTLLEGLAGVAVGRGQPEHAVRLFGAADALRATGGTPIRPVNRSHLEREMATVRTALGEERFKTLWDEGRAMAPKQAVSYMLDGLPSTEGADAHP